MIAPVLKYPGSKWGIAEWIVSQLPQHHSYVELFFGSGAVLFRKPPSPIETVNDLDHKVYNLFKVIREKPDEIARLVAGTPYSREAYDLTYFDTDPGNDVEQARRFLIQCWQGHGFRTNGYKNGWKNDVQGRERAYALHNWYRLPKWIGDAAERLRQVQIENMPALELIERFRYQNVLVYADPPYVLGTRTGKQYTHEMTDQDHTDLLEALDKHPGPVLLSGYACDLYDSRLSHWYRQVCQGQAEGGLRREEVLWLNPVAAHAIEGNLFEGRC